MEEDNQKAKPRKQTCSKSREHNFMGGKHLPTAQTVLRICSFNSIHVKSLEITIGTEFNNYSITAIDKE